RTRGADREGPNESGVDFTPGERRGQTLSSRREVGCGNGFCRFARNRDSTRLGRSARNEGSNRPRRGNNGRYPTGGASPMKTLAAVNGGAEVVAVLLDRGADPNAVTKGDRSTPLHRAAQRGHVAIVSLLLAKGAAADGGWKPKEFAPPMTPLHFAVHEGHLDAA